MSREHIISILLIICCVLFLLGQLYALKVQGEIIIISERVGKEIDQAEREKFKLFEGIKGLDSNFYIKLPDNSYHLFQDIKGFQSAVCYKFPNNRYILKIMYTRNEMVFGF